MSPVIARALRRASLATGALTATLTGHVLTGGGTRVLPVAPLIWLATIALAVLPGAARRSAPGFRARSPVALLATLLGGQAALHLVLHGAPWALGLGAGHAGHGPLVTPAAALMHLVLALAFLTVIVAGQGVLLRAMAVARAVARAVLRPGWPRSSARPVGEALRDDLRALSQWRCGPRSSRGPPAAALAWAAPGRAGAAPY